ncbi:MAG: alkaline phosphatase D family protein [Myxococcales bacterium]|nr:alkaline phosphatase D family protein [Myxococcales bacterium]
MKRAALLSVPLAAPLAGCGDDESSPEPEPEPTVFLHGVASGDPLADAVILWTRVTVADGAPTDVEWTIASDAEFADVVAEGVFSTDADRDFTVKVDVTGLAPATTHYYRFTALGETSPVGRTRTAPTGSVARLRFGICSCASYAHGFFNAYRLLARRYDLDVVLHLGDYIYEYGDGSYGDPQLGDARAYDPPHEIVTLEDYRRRYAHYRSDADLQEVHRQHPFITVWDDHESANDSYTQGAENHDPSSEGEWSERKAQAQRAYFEWMPIREQADGRIWRSFRYGDLVDLIMLDTRLWGREQQNTEMPDSDPTRQLLGDDQEAWLDEQLTTSTARWRLVGQQVMMGQLQIFYNGDQWDGYPAARERFFDVLESNTIDNTVVLTGDIHSSWAIDLTRDPMAQTYDPATGAGSLGVELVTPGITSPGFPAGLAAVADGIKEDNRHMKLVELVSRGYIVLDVDQSRVEAAWYHMADITTVNDDERLGGVFTANDGENFLVEQAEPTPAPDAPAPAP